MSVELYQKLSSTSNGLFKEHGSWWIVADRAPSDRTREELRAALQSIDAAMRDRGEAMVIIAVNDVLKSLDRSTSSDSGHGALIKSYVDLLKDYPPWAVHKASLEFRKGTAVHHHNPARAPTTAEFCRQVEHILDPWKDRQRTIRSVVEARIYREPARPAPEVVEKALTRTFPRDPVTRKLTAADDGFEAQRQAEQKAAAAVTIMDANEKLRRAELKTIGVDPDEWLGTADLWIDQHPGQKVPALRNAR